MNIIFDVVRFSYDAKSLEYLRLELPHSHDGNFGHVLKYIHKLLLFRNLFLSKCELWSYCNTRMTN